jgi:hypothetical protein
MDSRVPEVPGFQRFQGFQRFAVRSVAYEWRIMITRATVRSTASSV